MMGSIQMLAGLAVVIGVLEAVTNRRLKPLFTLALPGLAVWLILGWTFGWASPD